MTNKERVLQLFQEKPYTIGMGASTVSKRYNLPVSDIINVRNALKHEKNSKGIKILIVDIETSPLRAYVWRRWKQNVYLDQTISEWFMLTWSAKWLGEDKVHSMRLTGKEALKEDDSRIVKPLWDLLDKADVVIAHNGKKFDIPKMNSRFILNNLPPTSPYIQIDTKEVAAKEFGFSSNKLDALAGYFGIRHKDDTEFELWDRCMRGDDEALKYMEKYNLGDVVILEQVYLKLRPYIKNHPNTGLYVSSLDPVCPTCGSPNLTLQNGKFFYTQTGKYQVIRCNACGALARSRFDSLPANIKKTLIKSV